LNAVKLRFTPTAWAKLQFFCHQGDTEIGGFGITACNDLLLVEDFATVKQSCTMVTVAFDDDAVADFYDQQVDLGRKPNQFSRIWLHTHPGDSPKPSGIDEETFRRVFGACDWALMFILARGGKTYARLRFNVGPGGQVIIPVEVDFSQPFPACDHAAWLAEYLANVQQNAPLSEFADPQLTYGALGHRRAGEDWDFQDWHEHFNDKAWDGQEPQEPERFLDEEEEVFP